MPVIEVTRHGPRPAQGPAFFDEFSAPSEHSIRYANSATLISRIV